jgi:hypothetical protein
MKATRFVLVCTLMVFTFIGNIGFGVFTHSCEKDGVFRSYFLPNADHCEEQPVTELPACCLSTSLNACSNEQLENDCCQDDVRIYRINSDYLPDVQLTINQLSGVFQPQFWCIQPRVYCAKVIHDYTDPPPKWRGKSIRLFTQVFRI